MFFIRKKYFCLNLGEKNFYTKRDFQQIALLRPRDRGAKGLCRQMCVGIPILRLYQMPQGANLQEKRGTKYVYPPKTIGLFCDAHTYIEGYATTYTFDFMPYF